jgi:hypothetical protein
VALCCSFYNALTSLRKLRKNKLGEEVIRCVNSPNY